MNIEIIEFYPLEGNEDKSVLTGTLRIKLTDLGIHILGIFVSRRKNFWYFAMPGRNGTHHETGEPVRYPFIVFDDQEQQQAFMKTIREKGRSFIENRIVDKKNTLIFPHKRRKGLNKTRTVKVADDVTAVKEAVSIKRCIGWIDLPKRKDSKRL